MIKSTSKPTTSSIVLKDFLEIPYDQLEEMNLEAKQKQQARKSDKELETFYLKYLADEKRIKAISVCFSDLEGRFHMLDYDKKFLLKSHDNLTFDGSSIRGFSVVSESDLRLAIDWGSFRWLPSDVFGPGKVIVFGLIKDAEGKSYKSDMRGVLKDYSEELYKKGMEANVAVECEGFLFDGLNSEQTFNTRHPFVLVSSGGYYNSLPNDPLKLFIDRLAEAQRAMAFENEKDHPEVAPSQFELNYSYSEALLAADQLQLYKLVARQVAANMGYTASFLPKPIAGINGSGMHTNISISKRGKNSFYDANGEEKISKFAWEFVDRILNSANDLCLILNPSVNAYRRLDPHFEAPNQIKSSPVDRTSMVRIPLGNEKSARIEVRTVAPDANPYLAFYALLRTGLEGPMTETITSENRRTRTKYLPGNIYDAIRLFKASSFMEEVLGSDNKDKYVERKVAAAERSPKELGTQVKTGEIIYHHEVTNQHIWGNF
ncbi:MAG: glutamine synthetase [Candidatus Eremiobacteraeota bacterium]|nr:glutamine synthetase [Candidatus Eremiobacteraeota bacterium]MCW5868217.1 glutamine synthetase [Candidatus Eremiobacteraeota bacterium]